METFSFAYDSTARIESLPHISSEELESLVRKVKTADKRVIASFAFLDGEGTKKILYLFQSTEAQLIDAVLIDPSDEFKSLTSVNPALHLFEREIFEQYGIRPKGHPWLKPVRFVQTITKDNAEEVKTCGDTRFFRLEGENVHEVAVGPVHAGVIEPGHFRFQCHGEIVYNLEISLGYQHRGIEETLIGGPNKRSLYEIEAASGDTTIGHVLAYCENIEKLSGVTVPERAAFLRSLALELERLGNHTGDLGALSGDVGYLPTASFCGRIRGDLLNMTALLCGSRLGRSFLCPGGTKFDIDAERARELLKRLDQAGKDLCNAVDLMFDKSSVLARFEHVGRVTKENARDLGLVGPAARASGIKADARVEYPSEAYRLLPVEMEHCDRGDVESRARIRYQEALASLEYCKRLIKELPEGAVRVDMPAELASNTLAVSLVEGWRGEIVHVAITDNQGRFLRYKIIDPSFHNWSGLAHALRSQQVSDFPLCNKSFNLSYCGYDL